MLLTKLEDLMRKSMNRNTEEDILSGESIITVFFSLKLI